jgi:uncharacterized protein YyaL (SSP411 family)
MTPDRRVFFSGTYMPADNNYGRAGLKSMMKTLVLAYKNNKEEVLKSATSIENAMKNRTDGEVRKVSLDIGITKDFVKGVLKDYDDDNKGIGLSPKFPHATSFDMLIDVYRLTGDKKALSMASDALFAMSQGGIYDQIEGGFYRYSVDELWMIPHFEKMLYTNAELLEAFANAYGVTGKERFKTVIKETVENINERFLKDGLYFSASDADSDGEEGKYFVFDYKKSLEDLQKGGFSKGDAKEILNYFSIYKGGNFEHKQTNPYLGGMDKPKNLEKAKAILKANRQKKNYPFIDHKVQTSWNALFLVGLFKSAKHVDKSYAKQALNSLDTLLKNLYIDGELYHQMIVGKKPKVTGYLEDYAFLVSALIQAYQVKFDKKYLKLAKLLGERAVMKFYKNGVWYMSDDAFESKAEFYDASYRSAMAVMVEDLLQIAILSDNLKLYAFAKDTLQRNLPYLKSSASNYPYGLKTYLQSLLSPVVLKSTKENLEKNRKKLDKVNYPYLLLKPTEDENFLACKIDTCFAIGKDVDEVIRKIK